jgi:hypothetical protein
MATFCCALTSFALVLGHVYLVVSPRFSLRDRGYRYCRSRYV